MSSAGNWSPDEGLEHSETNPADASDEKMGKKISHIVCVQVESKGCQQRNDDCHIWLGRCVLVKKNQSDCDQRCHNVGIGARSRLATGASQKETSLQHTEWEHDAGKNRLLDFLDESIVENCRKRCQQGKSNVRNCCYLPNKQRELLVSDVIQLMMSGVQL